MPVRPVCPGQRVVSRAGRDLGREYLVYRVLDGNILLVVDGAARPLAKPKRKKLRHLELCRHIAADINRKLESNLAVSDAEVRQALAAWTKEGEGGNA